MPGRRTWRCQGRDRPRTRPDSCLPARGRRCGRAAGGRQAQVGDWLACKQTALKCSPRPAWVLCRAGQRWRLPTPASPPPGLPTRPHGGREDQGGLGRGWGLDSEEGGAGGQGAPWPEWGWKNGGFDQKQPQGRLGGRGPHRNRRLPDLSACWTPTAWGPEPCSAPVGPGGL